MRDVSPTVPYQLFVGEDIAAKTATVAWQAPAQKPGKPITIEQTSEGFASLHQRLLKTRATPAQILMVMEATGIYWLALATFFARLGYGVSVVNPTQAHHFAKALRHRERKPMPSMCKRSPNWRLSCTQPCGPLHQPSTKNWSNV